MNKLASCLPSLIGGFFLDRRVHHDKERQEMKETSWRRRTTSLQHHEKMRCCPGKDVKLVKGSDVVNWGIGRASCDGRQGPVAPADVRPNHYQPATSWKSLHGPKVLKLHTIRSQPWKSHVHYHTTSR
jgi:hypothetical protein